MSGWELWSSGYARRHIFWRLWVRIPAPYTGWTFFTYFCGKNGIVCLKRWKSTQNSPELVPFFNRSRMSGWELWSSGYGRRHIFWRLWVRIPAPYTGWTFFTYFCGKNGNVCLKRWKSTQNSPELVPFFNRSRMSGWELWSSGYGRRLIFWRLWVRIPVWSRMVGLGGLKMAFFGLFFFIFVFSTQFRNLLMTGFEPQISGIGSNRSANWATATAQ